MMGCSNKDTLLDLPHATCYLSVNHFAASSQTRNNELEFRFFTSSHVACAASALRPDQVVSTA